MTKPSTLKPTTAIYRRVVPAGDYWIHRVERGQVLRIVDLEGNQAADTLFFNAADPAERYSAVDTIREQRNLYLGVGSKLRSTDGNVMLEIVADTVGRHDTLGGACATESNTVRYALDKKTMHACRDSWLLAVAEHPDFGLTKRDITHNINFFMNVPVTPDGGLTFADGVSRPRRVRRDARRDGRHRPDLELPAAQQPLQRVQPDADRGADLQGVRGLGVTEVRRIRDPLTPQPPNP